MRYEMHFRAGHAEGIARSLVEVLEGVSLTAYMRDQTLQAVVQWKLVSLGEALSQARKADNLLTRQVPLAEGSIIIRNDLLDNYDSPDHGFMWSAVRDDLPQLIEQLQDLR